MEELTTMIHFNVPLHYNVHEFDLASDDTQQLLKTIAPIVREARYLAWGRVQTQPEMTVLLSVWKPAEKYTNFIESSEGKNFLLGLKALSSSHPVAESDSNDKERGENTAEPLIITAPFGTRTRVCYRQPVYAHTHIRLYMFPTPVAEDRRNFLRTHAGPCHNIMFGTAEIFEEYSCYHCSPRRGWSPWPIVWSTFDGIPGEVDTKIQPVGEQAGANWDVMVTLMSWRSKEKEQIFRDLAVIYRKGRGLVPIFEDWQDTLKSEGAVEWKDYYVDFEMLDKAARNYILSNLT
ncbi:hypothetical protein F4776DRAFT_672877 [Hypoxylon sp. NC0597]|nr:hypothetical protein F4776DRAFT_672877 [Hypoxylon sp. NC0597]